jgi:hypothetical protein
VRGDGDADNPSDIDGNGDSDSASVGGGDNDSDSPTRESYRFPDKDDRATFEYGNTPSPAQRHMIISAVKRYYAALSSGDDAMACALLVPAFARSLVEDYGEYGPPYLRGANTCRSVLSKLSQHFHEELTEPITVFQAHVKDSVAQVVLGSRAMRASSLSLVWQGKSWKLERLFGEPLP